MKTLKRILVLIVLLAATTPARAATNDLTSLLQQGLFEEEANRNLDAAIANYQSLATQFDKDRQVAATAVFRLGEVYRKLGKTNEAVVQYQRILHDFSDQQTLATLSRQNLRGLGAGPQETGAAASSASRAEQRRLLEEEIKLVQKRVDDAEALVKQQLLSPGDETLYANKRELLSLQRQLAALSDEMGATGTGAQSRQAIAALRDDLKEAEQNLAELMAQTNSALLASINSTNAQAARLAALLDDQEKELSRRRAVYPPNSPRILALREEIDANKKTLGALLETGTVSDRIQFLRARIARLRLQLAENLVENAEGSMSGSSATVTDDEEKEIRRIQQLIQNSPDLINAPSEGPNHNLTPLENAADRGWLKVAAYLLDHGADVNARGGTALFNATEAGNRAMVEFLLAHGANVNAVNNTYKRTPLETAVQKGFEVVTETLLANMADVNARDSEGNTPLFAAAERNQQKISQMLLKAGATGNITNNQGRTPLSYAAERGSTEVMKLLLDAKADPNGGTLDPPLLCAIRNGDMASAELLLKSGADVNAERRVQYPFIPGLAVNSDSGQITPLWVAVFKGQVEMVRLLLEAGANPDVRSDDGRTPLMWAAGSLSVSNVEILLEHEANPNLQDRGGETALHWAVGMDALGIGAEWTTTPDRKETVALLLNHGADPNLKNGNGKTPLDFLKDKIAQQTFRTYSPTLVPKQKAFAAELASLLCEHGALDNLPHLDRITLSRSSANFSAAAFSKWKNDWNHFTLLEAFAENYGLINTSVSGEAPLVSGVASEIWGTNAIRFPKLNAVVIHRPSTDGKTWKDIQVNVADILSSGDCSRDVWLQWGDVVEVPEADHPVAETWEGLSEPERKPLIKCISRTVTISINNTNTPITINPMLILNGLFPWMNGGQIRESRRQSVSFMVRSVLDQSKLIRFSSDLSHVKVTRRDAASGKTQSWVLDCSNPNTAPDLWLRDGDVIEVPEK